MAKKLWGTRFKGRTSKLADKFTSSISYDKRLAIYDVIGSIAHAKMLGKCKVIPRVDANKIVRGLNSILKTLKTGKHKFDAKTEDVHSDIQNALKKRIGSSADKLHTARSRNDQVVLDMKLYSKDTVGDFLDLLGQLKKSILTFARKNVNVVIPAYTHLQPAQCILLAHQMLAYVEMLKRDEARFLDLTKRLDEMPLGSCALSGTSLKIDRAYVAKLLGFSKVTQNSIDTVSDRDFVIELLGDLSMLSMHFSRIAEDLILWSTREFNFINIDWSFCTGSSIMPHKKNPDVLELIRATTGKILGNYNSVLVMMKGLPLSYNRDMQLDKPPLFEAADTLKEILVILTELFKNIEINNKAISAKLNDESLFSVDMLEYLIRKGLSYREAHDTIGKMVKSCLDKGKKISKLSQKELKKYSIKFTPDVMKLLNSKVSVGLKSSYGSTNPKLVRKQIKKQLS